MATLANDKARSFELNGGETWNEFPIIASDTVYRGACVGESASLGTVRPCVAGDTFMGFAAETCANESGAANAKQVKVQTKGRIWLTVTSGDNIDDLDDTVYASDDDTFTKASTGNTTVGKIVRYDSGRLQCLVAFEAANERSI